MNNAYLFLKTAHSLYGKGPIALDQQERAKVESLAAKQYDIERRVLGSNEARAVVVPPVTLESAWREIRSRYASDEEFNEDLASNRLTTAAFLAALERELKVEAVLEKVGSRAATVNDLDVELYYHYHGEQMLRPETRIARHILVTINPELAENTRTAATARIMAIAKRLAKDPQRFEEQAMKHSECPTALQGGLLGEVRKGQLYSELETVLFTLAPMHISDVVESTLGLHLLRCDSIEPAGKLRLDQVREKIRELLVSRRKRICQNAWLRQTQDNANTS